MDLKTIVAIFDLNEHTGATEDQLVAGHLSELKKEGFRSSSNVLIRINKENLYNHETDMFAQVIVMVKGGKVGGDTRPIYTEQ